MEDHGGSPQNSRRRKRNGYTSRTPQSMEQEILLAFLYLQGIRGQRSVKTVPEVPFHKLSQETLEEWTSEFPTGLADLLYTYGS